MSYNFYITRIILFMWYVLYRYILILILRLMFKNYKNDILNNIWDIFIFYKNNNITI